MASAVGFEATGGGGAAPGVPGRPTLEHAFLVLHEPSPDGSLSKAGPEIGRVSFQFNPKELTLSKSASWSRSTGKGNKKSGPPQYQGPQPSKLSLEMFFDACDKQDDSVVRKVEKLFACCVPTDPSHQQKKGSPPWVLFRWGGLTSFLAYISSVSAKYTVFTSTGLPIRATCTEQLDELAGEAPGQNPTSGSLVPRSIHQLIEGDSLPGIAYREYGDPGLWRALAEVNRIDDPVRLPVGHPILLPAVEDLGSAPVAVRPGAVPGRSLGGLDAR